MEFDWMTDSAADQMPAYRAAEFRRRGKKGAELGFEGIASHLRKIMTVDREP